MRKLLNDIPWNIKAEDMLEHPWVVGKKNVGSERIRDLFEFAHSIGRPKVLFGEASVSPCEGNRVEIDRVVFTSRLLKMNLEGKGRVFPYVATCGLELDTLKPSDGDFADPYLLDAVKELTVLSVHDYFSEYLTERYGLTNKAHMNPGSLLDWPLQAQPGLFSLLGDVEGLTGVRLTEENIMLPMKSISGIFFPTKTRFESCMLCARDGCLRRRADYAPELAARYGV